MAENVMISIFKKSKNQKQNKLIFKGKNGDDYARYNGDPVYNIGNKHLTVKAAFWSVFFGKYF